MAVDPDREGPPGRLRPLAIGLGLWLCVWVPVILWSYGPQNFLWLCNVAQFVLLVGLWRGDRLLISSQAGTVVLVGLVWTPDFLLGLATGGELALMTAYMFNPDLPLLARVTSLYHIGLPVLVLVALRRCPYHRRGPWLQSALAAGVLPLTWLVTDPQRNINWLHAPAGLEVVWLSGPGLVLLALFLYPLLLFWPGHWLITALARTRLLRGGTH